MRRFIFVLIVCPLLFSQPVLRASDIDQQGDAIVRRIHAARRRIKSGQVQIRGVRESYDPEEPEYCYEYPVDADLVFDWPSGRLRYDADRIEEMGFVSIEELADSEDRDELIEDSLTERTRIRLQSILIPDLYAFYETTSTLDPVERVECDTNLEIFGADSDAPVPVVNVNHCFDVRSVGLFNFWEFVGQTHVMGYQLPDVYCHMCDLDIAIERLLEWPVVAIERDGDLTTLRYQGGMTITLNEAQGYTPLAYFDTRGTPHPDYISDTVASTVQWKQINDVWVPTDFMIELLDVDGEGSALRHTYTLEWSLVNQPVPDHYFDWRNFTDVREQTMVFDSRSGEPLQIGEWKNGEYAPFESPLGFVPPALTEPADSKWSGLLITNGVILCLLPGGTLAWRLLRRQHV